MQQDNDHMDQMFRNAADNYPLNTAENRWDEISAKLQQPEEDKPVPFFQKFRNRLLILGVLGLLSTAGWLVYKAGVQDGMQLATSSSSIPATPKGTSIIAEEDDFAVIEPETQLLAREEAVKLENSVQELEHQNPASLTAESQSNYLPSTNDTFGNNEENSWLISGRSPNAFTPVTHSLASGQRAMKEKLPGALLANNKNQSVQPVSFEKAKKEEVPNTPKGEWYWRADAGLLETVVDGRWANKPGWLVGGTIGKSLGRGWRLEAGLAFSQQVLDVSGKSFSLSKIEPSMPAGMDLKTVHSVQSIMEVPITVRKSIAKLGAGSQISAAAGVSVRWLLNEKNDYDMMVNGQQKLKQATYTTNYCYAPASVNLSVAYEKNLKSGAALIVEPFYELPVIGTGMGNMKVQQLGLKVGISKFIK